ncbi:MAG: RHS repeat protein, partial [Planctomycetes bacterium]|nr:RHS repeat protein [Planctomycetota bacterium]
MLIPQAEYDEQGRMLWSKDAELNETTYVYDGFCCGRAKTITKPNGKTEEYEYDYFGNVESFTDEAGYVTIYDYDEAGRLKSIDYPNDEALTYEYDGYNLSRITDALGRSVSRTYDARGNITSIK